MQPLSLMRDRMMKADAAGLQICTHAIGDRAISTVLDLYTEVVKADGAVDRRFRIEHAQHMAAKDFARFTEDVYKRQSVSSSATDRSTPCTEIVAGTLV